MDSLTQIVLGASVGEAVLGKKVGNKAMLWGAVAATIPDLDVFFTNFFSPVDNLYVHRGFSHSILFAILIAPILGYFIHLIHRKKVKDVGVKSWMKLVFWSTVTHPLLDMFTNWGTQLFWPFEYRIAINNIFVLDPLYTLPFLTFLLMAAFKRRDHPKRRKYNRLGLIVSSSYLALSLLFKVIAYFNFVSYYEKNNISTEVMMTKPMPLTTFYWTATAKDLDTFHVAYYSIFGGMEDQLISIPQSEELIAKWQLKENIDLKRMRYLTKGFYVLREDSTGLFMEDIRFGLMSGFNPQASHHSLFKYLLATKTGKLTIDRSRTSDPKAFEDFSGYLKRIFGY